MNTEIDSTHAALLKGIAKSLKDVTARKVYADYLQEQNNAGWIIVANYPPEQWALWVAPYSRRTHYSRYHDPQEKRKPEMWRLCWLTGTYVEQKYTTRPDILTGWILTAYAEGTVKK